jgi:multidrug transporter EmrE-like cation transporter
LAGRGPPGNGGLLPGGLTRKRPASRQHLGNPLLKQSRQGALTGRHSPWPWLSLAFFILNVGLVSKTLDSLPVSVAAPAISGTNFLVVVLGAALVYGESLSLAQSLGLGSIVLGIVLVGQA